MASFSTSCRALLARPIVREVLLWSLPALLVGLVMRIVLMWQMPYGLYHDDTGDLLTTPHDWIERHQFQIHGKKTFLVPVVYLILALLRIPLLIAVPILQHILGLVLVLIFGALCRLWFARWRWFIIPITLVVAVNPPMLWYEHLLMAEAPAVFSLGLVALAGTLYALRQSWSRFAFFCFAFVFAAGARPEGKLLFGFGFFLLLLLHARRWRTEWRPFAILFVVALVTHFITRTGQAGLLLYTSVVRLTPTELKTAPGFEPYVQPLRTELEQRWKENLSFPQVKDRRAVAALTTKYMEDRAGNGRHFGHEEVDAFCLKLAAETCRKNLFYLPYYALQKFRFGNKEWMAGSLNDVWLYERQENAFAEHFKKPSAMPERVTGVKMNTLDDYRKFLREHYRPVQWFNLWQWNWQQAVESLRLPDEVRKNGKRNIIIRQFPILFLVSALGLIVVMFRRGILQPLHLAWGLTLVGLFFTIMLTANLRGRFRFVFEPFWYVYTLLLVDTLLFWLLPKRPVASVSSTAPADSAPAQLFPAPAGAQPNDPLL